MYSPSSCHLLLFLRYPQIGRTKTRLIPALGAAGAADFQRQMAKHIVLHLQHPNWNLQVHFSGAGLIEMQDFLGLELTYRQQANGSLGNRLWYGFQKSFATRQALPSRAIAIGADCPDLSYRHIQQAFDALQKKEIVLGPASDGGYYLIGLRQPSEVSTAQLRMLFQGIDWSTPQVFQQTMHKVQQLNLSSALLEPLSDIDRPEDLAIWERLQISLSQIG